MAAGQLDRRQRLGHVVLAAEKGQVAIVERLDAERDAIHARRAEAPEAPRLDRGGVGLERDLDVIGRTGQRRSRGR